MKKVKPVAEHRQPAEKQNIPDVYRCDDLFENVQYIHPIGLGFIGSAFLPKDRAGKEKEGIVQGLFSWKKGIFAFTIFRGFHRIVIREGIFGCVLMIF